MVRALRQTSRLPGFLRNSVSVQSTVSFYLVIFSRSFGPLRKAQISRPHPKCCEPLTNELPENGNLGSTAVDGIAVVPGRKREPKRPTKRGRRSRSAERGRGFKCTGHRRAALGVGRLSRRRHSCPKAIRGFGVDLAWARQDKGVILSEAGFA